MKAKSRVFAIAGVVVLGLLLVARPDRWLRDVDAAADMSDRLEVDGHVLRVPGDYYLAPARGAGIVAIVLKSNAPAEVQMGIQLRTPRA